jgi:hypothetical protein
MPRFNPGFGYRGLPDSENPLLRDIPPEVLAFFRDVTAEMQADAAEQASEEPHRLDNAGHNVVAGEVILELPAEQPASVAEPERTTE